MVENGRRATEVTRAGTAATADDIATMRRLTDGIAATYAGGANVVMQLGWPEVGRGVFESKVHSGRGDLHPIKRARTTFTYLSVALFGTDEERAAYRQAITKQHVQVRSTPESPVEYDAMNPELQLWVAACLYYGLADMIERFHGPLEVNTADLLYRHGARLGTTLQVRPEMWPADRAAFDEYWRKGLARVEYDPEVRKYLVDTIGLGPFPWYLRAPLGRFVRFMNTGSLPDEFRSALGLTWSPRQQRRYDRVLRVTKLVSRLLPRVIRNQPFNLLLRDFRLRRRRGWRLV